MFDHTMTLLELEQRLQYMREQGAHDSTPVWITVPGIYRTQIDSVKIHVPPMPMGRRVVLINGWFDRSTGSNK